MSEGLRRRFGTARTAAIVVTAAATLCGCSRFRADVEMHNGAVCYHAGDMSCAVQHYAKAAALNPASETAWKNLAYSYWSRFDPDSPPSRQKADAQGCTRAFQHYIALHEDNARPSDPQWVKDDDDARGLMVQMWEQSKNYHAAIRYFQERLRQNPQDDLAMLRLGELNAEAGNWQTALQWYNERADLNAAASPNVRADIYYTIGTACFQRLHNHPEIKGQERIDTVEEGLDGLEKAQELRPNHGPTYVYINLLYRERALGEPSTSCGLCQKTDTPVPASLPAGQPDPRCPVGGACNTSVMECLDPPGTPDDQKLCRPDRSKRNADLMEASYYYNYAKYLMTLAPIAPHKAPASQKAHGAAQAAASRPVAGATSQPVQHAENEAARGGGVTTAAVARARSGRGGGDVR